MDSVFDLPEFKPTHTARCINAVDAEHFLTYGATYDVREYGDEYIRLIGVGPMFSVGRFIVTPILHRRV